MYAKIKSKIFKPESLEQIFNTIENLKNFKFFAGGTDLFIKIKENKEKYDNLIYLGKVKELKNFSFNEDFFYIGAGLTFSEILDFSQLQEFECFVEALKSIGSPQIRNMGTIGGNIVNMSPAADSLPPLILYESEIEVADKNKVKTYFLEQKPKLKESEVVVKIKMKKIKGKSGYIKIGKRKAMTISRLNIAYLKEAATNKFRFVTGAMTPYPIRLKSAENVANSKNFSENELFQSIEHDILSASNYRPSFDYKMPVLKQLIIKILRELK